MHEVLVNRLGGLSLPRKSVVRLTDRPDMTLDVYRGRKTTIQYNTIVYPAPSHHPTTPSKLVGRPGTESLPSTLAPPNHPSRHWKFTQHHRTTRPPSIFSGSKSQKIQRSVCFTKKTEVVLFDIKFKKLIVCGNNSM